MADTDAFAPLLAAAQSVLSATLNAQVRLHGADRLTEDERRNTVLRCTVSGAPQGAPASVIIKRASMEEYDPEDVDSWDIQRFFRDWGGAQFLSAVAAESPHGPRFYGGDRGLGFVLLEDLGEHRSLVQPLLEGDATSAEQALLAFATRLGKMHADTVGQATFFDQLVRDLGLESVLGVQASCQRQAHELRTNAEKLGTHLDSLGVQTAVDFPHELETIANTVASPGPFLAYIHGDPCPDNIFYTGDQLRLIDFEFGRFGHALRDGVYGRMLFPTCWCANRLPDELVGRMEQRYRAELVHGCLAAHDDRTFERAVVEICGSWLIDTLGWLLERVRDQDYTWGIATVRPRILARLEAFIAVSETYNHLPALRDTVNRLLQALRQLWPEAQPLPVYPTFRPTP